MIYFIDEDQSQIRPFMVELQLRGYMVERIADADEAFQVLQSAKEDVQLVLIDVMLSAHPVESQSRFSRSNTNDFTQTGLQLLEDLILVNPDVFPSKVVLFSMASSNGLVRKIEASSKKNGIPYFDKSEFPTTMQFGDSIDALLGVAEGKRNEDLHK